MPVLQRQVPHDVISLITDILSEGSLDRDDRDCHLALRGCLRVSRSFCHHSRRHLFRCVSLMDSPPEKFFDRAALLREIMAPQSNPQLGIISYIKVFSVEIFENPSLTVYTRRDAGLSTILDAFLRFESRLEEFHFWGAKVEWPQLSLNTQQLFCSIIRSPSLSVIHLYGPKKVPHTILTGAACKRLRLSSVTTGGHLDAEIPSLELSNIPQLKLELFVTDNGFPLQYVSSNGPRVNLSDLSTSPFSLLKSLTLEVDSEDQYRLGHVSMMPEVRLSLKSLQISLSIQSGPIAPIDLGQFSELESLEINCNCYEKIPLFLLDTSPSIIRILDTPTSCPSLKRLALSFRSGYKTKNNRIQFEEASIWPEIDALLCKPQFASLAKLRIFFKLNIRSDYPSAKDREEFLAVAMPRFRAAFPSLSVSNSIEFIVELQDWLID